MGQRPRRPPVLERQVTRDGLGHILGSGGVYSPIAASLAASIRRATRAHLRDSSKSCQLSWMCSDFSAQIVSTNDRKLSTPMASIIASMRSFAIVSSSIGPEFIEAAPSKLRVLLLSSFIVGEPGGRVWVWRHVDTRQGVGGPL
jgi:hypothetical protein